MLCYHLQISVITVATPFKRERKGNLHVHDPQNLPISFPLMSMFHEVIPPVTHEAIMPGWPHAQCHAVCRQMRTHFDLCVVNTSFHLSSHHQMTCSPGCGHSLPNIPRLTFAYWESHQATGRMSHFGVPEIMASKHRNSWDINSTFVIKISVFMI